MKLLFLVLILASVLLVRADWLRQDSGSKVQFRGLSAVSDKVCWAAGAEGTFARTIDGSRWESKQIPGLEKLTFRSVVAWDADHATLLSIGVGDLSRIYHTEDGGKKWILQFKNPDPKAFYDCIQFWDRKHGIALSDPVEGKFRILTTSNGGKHWNVMPSEGMPPALTGEGAFAASGTCLVVGAGRLAWFGTGGGAQSRVFHTRDGGLHWRVNSTPIEAGKPTSGIFGLNRSQGTLVAVGGDYKDEQAGSVHMVTSDDDGISWSVAKDVPNVLFECQVGDLGFDPFLFGPVFVAAKRSYESSWSQANIQGLHTASFAGAMWAAGDDGQIYKWILDRT